ncbi:MAG: hypothetical protein U0359_36630 [Byssovorax sp.]
MPHRAPPPDFRHVSLQPGPSAATLAVGAGALGAASFGVALWGSGHAMTAIGCAAASALAAGLVLGRDRRDRGVRQASMTIVPWGVLVDPGDDLRVLRWPAIREIRARSAHAMEGGTPRVIRTAVQVLTEREALGGQTPGPAGLEGLIANLPSYAAEAGRPIAIDLEGRVPCGDGATEPVIDDLRRAAEELCTTAAGAVRLLLPPGGYRRVGGGGVGPETLDLLRAILRGSEAEEADPRPLAAMAAALLGARDLLPELIRLGLSPHPVMAVVARAAALRLGAPRARVGSLDEIALFLFEEDSEALERWAESASPG